jgi:uncharacterized glyoxalase superfamily protein PhnB
MKLTPVLIVDEIEKSLPFWVERLGFAKTVEAPEGSRLGFAILVKDAVELMLQTWSSAEADVPGLVPKGRTVAALFVEVEDFGDILKRIEGCEIIVPERTTSYGMREIGVREPGGHIVIFAAPIAK